MSSYGLWRIEHGGYNIGVNFGSLSGVLHTSLPRGNKRDYVYTRHLYDGVLLVLYVAALVASGS